MKDLNNYISKRHQNMVVKFNKDLEEWAKATGEAEAELYEDINTWFTLSNLRLENGCLLYNYDGKEVSEQIVQYDEEEKEYYEMQGIDGIAEGIKFWRSCLRRAKRYWETDSDTLDKMSDGEVEDTEE
jgi:hypothetical protein